MQPDELLQQDDQPRSRREPTLKHRPLGKLGDLMRERGLQHPAIQQSQRNTRTMPTTTANPGKGRRQRDNQNNATTSANLNTPTQTPQPPPVPSVHPSVLVAAPEDRLTRYSGKTVNIAFMCLGAFAIVSAISGIARIGMGWWKVPGVDPKV